MAWRLRRDRHRGNGTCTGEQAFEDPPTLQAAVNELDGQCRPLAR
jgi:hypothetical protein